ncbi:MAG: hypothetical protein ACRDQZ_13140 [Mycobacteriales bacterium]
MAKRKRERFSEYFDFERWPEKAEYKVTRLELFAVLQRHWSVVRDSRWYRRLWRWLKAKMGSGRLVVPRPPEGE